MMTSRGPGAGAISGLGRAPYIDLRPYIDTSSFAALHEEICWGLSQVDVSYTGGSHRWMGITPKALPADPHPDYGLIISQFSRDEFIRFVRLADDPRAFDLDAWQSYAFGEDNDTPLSRAQISYLKYRYGAYFPWKVHYALGKDAQYWESKHLGDSSFTADALELFPQTCAFIRSLPFIGFGRCDIMGLEANDHGTVHRDGLWLGPEGQATPRPPYSKAQGRDPTTGDEGLPRKSRPDHFITFCPGGGKRLFLWDDLARRKVYVESPVYWFNDSDYHGVEADPYFRYSIRVDGVFLPEFAAQLTRDSEVVLDVTGGVAAP